MRKIEADVLPFCREHNVGVIAYSPMARGLLTYPMGGTIDGRQGDHVLLAPPYLVEPDEIDAIVQRLRAAIDAATQEAATA